MSLDSDFNPRIDMEFDSLDDALMFWLQYGGTVGFGFQKYYFNNAKELVK